MKRLISIASLLLLVGCGSAKIKKEEVLKIKKVAIIAYSVPATIEFKDDPREGKKEAGLMDLVKVVAKSYAAPDSTKAAELSYNEFVKNINASTKLPFKTMTLADLKKNKKFQELVVSMMKADAPVVAETQASGWMGKLQSFATTQNNEPTSNTVTGLATFGLDKDWRDSSALMKTKTETDFIQKALEVLGVDAVMIVNDMGFSFSCEACIGGTGSASTGSAFNASLITKDMKSAMDLRQWFGFSKASTPIVAGIVPPNMHEKLFIAHGAKMATEFLSEYESQTK